MANRTKKTASKKRRNSGGGNASPWLMVSLAVILLLSGFIAKLVFFPNQAQTIGVASYQEGSSSEDPVESGVRLVASNFRCACGGCGELPLIECECDMPRGAIGEKRFIREKLRQGLNVEQVIQLVDESYGHRIT